MPVPAIDHGRDRIREGKPQTAFTAYRREGEQPDGLLSKWVVYLACQRVLLLSRPRTLDAKGELQAIGFLCYVVSEGLQRFCDVTLYCSPSFATQVQDKDVVDPASIRGVSLRAHRVVLAACSELLGALLGAHEAQGEPVLVIDGAEPKHLKALLDYMYTGEMNVHHSQLASLLKTAEELRIKGLTDIRWNNKDEPPDTDSLTATRTDKKTLDCNSKPEPKSEPKPKEKPERKPESKAERPERPERAVHTPDKEDSDVEIKPEKFSVNGGPPPLIKLPTKDKSSPLLKRELSDTDSPSPKRQRMASINENSDDEDHDSEWQHGNLNRLVRQDITAERVVGWGDGSAGGSWERDASDDEWADAPADIGSFLHTRLRVDGDNSADEESNEGAPASTSSSVGTSMIDLPKNYNSQSKQTVTETSGPKSGPADPRFTDVVKLNEYLRHGRRPQFWEENYVKRVMDAVRVKELEMKQAAEILGVSYGTLYGRYRDVYGCINRPYRTARDFWQAKGPSEVLERLQRGELSLDAGATALGVSTSNLAAYMADLTPVEREFEPIPIEIDPSLTLKSYTNLVKTMRKSLSGAPTSAPATDKPPKKILVGSITDEETIPATVIATSDAGKTMSTTSPGSKWPSIRVASLEALRSSPPAPRAPAPRPPPPRRRCSCAHGPTSPSSPQGGPKGRTTHK
ncbi:hypothetical protein MSG28_014695 [Choristoneura fumiferana]|uniref:Uncharacterized protein n=1 Tax=Choristoneura fumiferana TaxID=7141 RepID=A0ACC0JSC3_CHOFU|nr:hypothetical protein MSG28_014695 [Choristoneura fumiferana]